ELGTDKLNATYLKAMTLAAGCHTYYILANDAKGVRTTYPTVGALLMPVGGVACNGDYQVNQPAAPCAGPAPDTAMLPDLAPSPPDLLGMPAMDLAGAPAADLGGVPTDDFGLVDNTGGVSHQAGCHCDLRGRRGGPGDALLPLLGIALAFARRRRSARRVPST